MWQHSAGTETSCRGGLVVSSASAFLFLKGKAGLSWVNFKVWLIGFLMLLCNIPPGRLSEAQFLGVPDCSSELVFCSNFVCVGASQWAQCAWVFTVTELSLFKSKIWMKWVSFKMQVFSCSVVSDSLQPHGLQHVRLPCPSPAPRACSNSCPLSLWCHPTISFSGIPFSSCPQSFPASGSFQMSLLFASGDQSTGVSALTSVLPMNTQD